MIDRLTIERVKEAAGIVDVMLDFGIDLRRSGREWLALCPFHADRHVGSFKVSERLNSYTCYSCGAYGKPVDFVMNYGGYSYPDAIRWLGKKYGIDVEGSDAFTPKPAAPRPKPEPLQRLTLPLSMVKHTTAGLEADRLCRWLRSLPWNGEQRGRLERMLRNYLVGHTDKDHFGRLQPEGEPGWTVFWYVDEQAAVRTGKFIRYREDGHRYHREELRYNSDWIHSRLAAAGRYDAERWAPELTLFGMHLLTIPGTEQATVNIVESEKTAIICAIAYGGMRRHLWMASGGLGMLSRERLAPLIDGGRHIVLYPDHDGIERWQQKAEEIGYRRLHVNTDMVSRWWRPEDGEKADVADVLLRIIGRAAMAGGMSDEERLARWTEQYPAVAARDREFGLKIKN